MELKAGDIIHAFCAFIPDYKYVICLCPKHPYFFLINSEPRTKTPDAQIRIKKEDFPFLSLDYSYINTATICTIYPDEISKATLKGSLPPHIKAEIIKVVHECGYLSPNQKTLIKTNLSTT
jgi:hypothetical protein